MYIILNRVKQTVQKAEFQANFLALNSLTQILDILKVTLSKERKDDLTSKVIRKLLRTNAGSAEPLHICLHIFSCQDGMHVSQYITSR